MALDENVFYIFIGCIFIGSQISSVYLLVLKDTVHIHYSTASVSIHLNFKDGYLKKISISCKVSLEFTILTKT